MAKVIDHGLQTEFRRRRTREQIERIKCAIYEFAKEEQPVTVRQTFYHLTTLGLIGKTERDYKQTVVRLMTQMRKDGDLPFDWVADATRWMRRPRVSSGLAEFLDDSARLYRRDLWQSQEVYLEIWLEKEALAGVAYQVTAEWGVPLMVTKGYPSLTFVHSAAEAIFYEDKPAIIYYLGDADPSGRDIPRDVESKLREFSMDSDIDFEVAAVTDDQIETLGLPSRPTKRTDSRAKNWEGGSVELDAIPPKRLRQMIAGLITRHIDVGSWNAMQHVEEMERETLRQIERSLSP